MSQDTSSISPPEASYRFSLDAEHIRKAANLANIPNRAAPTGLIEVIPPHLHYTTSTTDGAFTSTAKLDLADWAQDGAIQFTVETSLLKQIGEHWTGRLHFEYDPVDPTLSWSTPASHGKFRKAVTAAEARPTPKAAHPGVVIPAANLREAIKKASLFVGRPDKANRNLCGAELQRGLARGGYSLGFVTYESKALPLSSAVPLPKRSVGNVVTAVAKLSGETEVIAEGDVVRLRASNLDMSWLSDGYRLPRQVGLVFQQPLLSTVFVPTDELIRATMLLSIGLDWLQVQSETNGDLGRLVLTGHCVRAKATVPYAAKGKTPLTNWMSLDDLPEQLWPFSISVADLLAAAQASKSAQLELSATQTGLLVRSISEGHTMTAYLHGCQPG